MSEQPVVVERLAERRASLRLEQAQARDAQNVGQLPTGVNLTLYQGDDFYLNVGVTGAGVNLTGYTAKADIATAPGATVMASFTATVTNATTIALHLTAVEAAKLTANGVWDLQITDTAGVVTTLISGTVTVVKQVTV